MCDNKQSLSVMHANVELSALLPFPKEKSIYIENYVKPIVGFSTKSVYPFP